MADENGKHENGRPSPAPVEGEAVFLRLFDLGGTVNEKRLETALGIPAPAPHVAALRGAPEYVSFAKPLHLNLDRLDMDVTTGDGTPARVSARVYPVGGLAVSIRIPIRAGSLKDLSRCPEMDYRLRGRPVDRTRLYQTVFDAFIQAIRASYDEVFDEPVEPERYHAYCLTRVPGGAAELFRDQRAQIAALLAGDPCPERLSPRQVEEVTQRWFNYYTDDLVVVDWDCGFVVEPAAKYEDLLYVFEVANLELLLLRKYDQYLDRVLNRGYDEYEALLKGSPFFKKGARDVLAELSTVRMDMAEVTDELENVTKFFGDYYLARIYLGLSSKLHLTEYHKAVDEKLATLNDLYQTIVDHLQTRQNVLLEWTIVLLILVEIGMALLRI